MHLASINHYYSQRTQIFSIYHRHNAYIITLTSLGVSWLCGWRNCKCPRCKIHKRRVWGIVLFCYWLQTTFKHVLGDLEVREFMCVLILTRLFGFCINLLKHLCCTLLIQHHSFFSGVGAVFACSGGDAGGQTATWWSAYKKRGGHDPRRRQWDDDAHALPLTGDHYMLI